MVRSRNIKEAREAENGEPGGERSQVMSLEAVRAQSLLVLAMMMAVLVLEEESLRVFEGVAWQFGSCHCFLQP